MPQNADQSFSDFRAEAIAILAGEFELSIADAENAFHEDIDQFQDAWRTGVTVDDAVVHMIIHKFSNDASDEFVLARGNATLQ